MVTDVPIRSRLFICKLSCFQMIAGFSKITGMGKMGINTYPWVYTSLLQESLTERANRSARAGMVVLGRCGIAGGASTGERLWGWQELPAQYQSWALPMPHVLLFWIPRKETARKSLALGRRVIPVGSKRVQRESPRPAGVISRAGCQHLLWSLSSKAWISVGFSGMSIWAPSQSRWGHTSLCLGVFGYKSQLCDISFVFRQEVPFPS